MAELSPKKIALWGPSASGKTAFLALLYLRSTEFDHRWRVYPANEATKNWVQTMRERVDGQNQFPERTALSIVKETLSYEFIERDTDQKYLLETDDRPGVRYERMDADTLKALAEADGLVFFFDPLMDPKERERVVIKAFEDLDQVTRANRAGGLDLRPTAICLTKADSLIKSPEDLRRARHEPQDFVLDKIDPHLLQWADRFFATRKLFPVSSVGVRLQHGVVQPAVFFDESLEARWARRCKPLNLVEPFEWLFNHLD